MLQRLKPAIITDKDLKNIPQLHDLARHCFNVQECEKHVIIPQFLEETKRTVLILKDVKLIFQLQ